MTRTEEWFFVRWKSGVLRKDVISPLCIEAYPKSEAILRADAEEAAEAPH